MDTSLSLSWTGLFAVSQSYLTNLHLPLPPHTQQAWNVAVLSLSVCDLRVPWKCLALFLWQLKPKELQHLWSWVLRIILCHPPLAPSQGAASSQSNWIQPRCPCHIVIHAFQLYTALWLCQVMPSLSQSLASHKRTTVAPASSPLSRKHWLPGVKSVVIPVLEERHWDATVPEQCLLHVWSQAAELGTRANEFCLKRNKWL